jgi:hypothetical protein
LVLPADENKSDWQPLAKGVSNKKYKVVQEARKCASWSS